MGITLAVFKIVGYIPVEEDPLVIVARYLNIWSLIFKYKNLVGILLGPQDLLILRDDIILKISSLFAAVVKKSHCFLLMKNLNGLCENFIFDWTVSAIDMKNSLKVFAIAIGSLIHFSSFLIMDGVS